VSWEGAVARKLKPIEFWCRLWGDPARLADWCSMIKKMMISKETYFETTLNLTINGAMGFRQSTQNPMGFNLSH
jgi:hypothetical protein